MRDDINLLNLTNGMNYSVHQLAHLIEYAKQAEQARQRGQEERIYDVESVLRYRAALQNIADTFALGGTPSKEVLQAAWKLRLQVGRGHHKPGAKPARDPNGELTQLCAETRAVLFDSQKEVLVDYQPCLIPPKNLKDPVRVGQANDTGPAIRLLEGIRAIAQKRWDEKRPEIVERTLSRVEQHQGKFPEGEREEKKKALLELLEKTRAMSDVDFELQKEDLAEACEQFYRKEVLKEELKELVGEHAAVDHKIRSIILHPRAALIYQMRLDQLKEQNAGKPVDLDKISPADNCKHGGCAIKEK